MIRYPQQRHALMDPIRRPHHFLLHGLSNFYEAEMLGLSLPQLGSGACPPSHGPKVMGGPIWTAGNAVTVPVNHSSWAAALLASTMSFAFLGVSNVAGRVFWLSRVGYWIAGSFC